MQATVDDLVGHICVKAENRSRVLIGITGAPGSGKSTLASLLATRLAPRAAVVGMDGFHLAQAQLDRLGRADRKGAPDTFDAAGYVALLRRLRADDPGVVYAPLFRRDIEEPIAAAVAVPADMPIVITEGNYLLLDEPGWQEVRTLLDEVWFLDIDQHERHRRLVHRRMQLGATQEDAERWTLGSDEQNSRTVTATRERASRVIALAME